MRRRTDPAKYIERIEKWDTPYLVRLDVRDWSAFHLRLLEVAANWVSVRVTHQDGFCRELVVFLDVPLSDWPVVRLTQNQAVAMAKVWLGPRSADDIRCSSPGDVIEHMRRQRRCELCVLPMWPRRVDLTDNQDKLR